MASSAILFGWLFSCALRHHLLSFLDGCFPMLYGVLKHCPIIRTMTWKIIEKSWKIGKAPTVWKNGLTVPIHKKGVNTDPANFRPITLEPVLCKAFTSWMRNRIYKHLCENEYIETNIQKGFWSSIAGMIKHTQHLTYLINHA